MLRCIEEHGMQGVETDCGSPEIGSDPNDLFEVSEITDAPVGG